MFALRFPALQLRRIIGPSLPRRITACSSRAIISTRLLSVSSLLSTSERSDSGAASRRQALEVQLKRLAKRRRRADRHYRVRQRVRAAKLADPKTVITDNQARTVKSLGGQGDAEHVKRWARRADRVFWNLEQQERKAMQMRADELRKKPGLTFQDVLSILAEHWHLNLEMTFHEKVMPREPQYMVSSPALTLGSSHLLCCRLKVMCIQ